MIFQDNVIKEYLKNVYFVTGTPCGGKTTISRALAKKYNLMVYDVDKRFSYHKLLSNPIDQPAMNLDIEDADAYFGRPYKEYAKWLMDNTREQLDYVIMDLIRLSQNQRVICALHLTIEVTAMLTEYERVVFMVKNPTNIIDEYCNRPDHDGFKCFINSAKNIEKAKANCNKTLEFINKQKYEQIKQSKYFWIERDSNSTVEETLNKVEQHFLLCR